MPIIVINTDIIRKQILMEVDMAKIFYAKLAKKSYIEIGFNCFLYTFASAF